MRKFFIATLAVATLGLVACGVRDDPVGDPIVTNVQGTVTKIGGCKDPRCIMVIKADKPGAFGAEYDIHIFWHPYRMAEVHGPDRDYYGRVTEVSADGSMLAVALDDRTTVIEQEQTALGREVKVSVYGMK